MKYFYSLNNQKAIDPKGREISINWLSLTTPNGGLKVFQREVELPCDINQVMESLTDEAKRWAESNSEEACLTNNSKRLFDMKIKDYFEI